MKKLLAGLFLVMAAAVGAQEVLSGYGEPEYESDLDWAQVRYVVAQETREGVWRFAVSVEHNDQGWDHYANIWQVVHPETLEVYGTRELLHPHDDEQPFIRSQAGIAIPPDVDKVLVRAACNVHDYSGGAVLVDLNAASGELFEVERR
ncbi:MAG: hypothetical protein ACLFP4_08875 [Spirochaetales bacterium]